MKTITWKLKQEFGGAILSWIGYKRGHQVIVIQRTYRATARTSRSGVLPRIPQYGWLGHQYPRLKDAKASAEKYVAAIEMRLPAKG